MVLFTHSAIKAEHTYICCLHPKQLTTDTEHLHTLAGSHETMCQHAHRQQTTLTSTSFQRLYCLLRAVLQTPMTSRHSLLFSCSVTELNLAMRTRQNSSSVSGPDSSVILVVAVLASLSARSASVCLHHSAKTYMNHTNVSTSAEHEERSL